MVKDYMQYDAMAQEALRGVLRDVLTRVQSSGLPGDHHLYIIFCTDFAGVELSSRLRERYPKEMTIVLQHQFWGLKVTEDAIEVDLSFNRRIEHLRVPFKAIKGFLDPSVEFGLQLFVEGEDAPLFVQSANKGQRRSRSLEPSEESLPSQHAADASLGRIVRLDSFRKKESGT